MNKRDMECQIVCSELVDQFYSPLFFDSTFVEIDTPFLYFLKNSHRRKLKFRLIVRRAAQVDSQCVWGGV